MDGIEAVAAVKRVLADGSARRARERAGVSARALGSSIGVSSATVAAWERGDRSPRDPATAANFLNALAAISRLVVR